MAKFEIASAITGINEGGYAFTPRDTGLETYCGISRKFWPNWAGWRNVDSAKLVSKDIATINRLLKGDTHLQEDILQFYRKNFWDVNKLDQINDQELANTIYDFGVNAGVMVAAKTLQDVVGVKVDGIIGQQTITAVNALNGEMLYNEYNDERKHFYEALSSKPGQAQFRNSWLSRLKPYQK